MYNEDGGRAFLGGGRITYATTTSSFVGTAGRYDDDRAPEKQDKGFLFVSSTGSLCISKGGRWGE